MRLLNPSLPLAWVILAWLLLVPLAARSLWRLRAGPALLSGQQHLWLAGVVLVSWLWTMQARAVDGAAFGMFGAAFFALVFGRDWARLGLLAAVAVHFGVAGGHWANLGIAGLLLAVLPSSLACTLQRQIERRLPKNLFVFIIGNGMFVTLATTVTTSALLLFVAWLLRPAAADADHLGYALLLAWGEALVTGMLFSALVIFGPHLVRTYRQDLYLPPRRGF